MKFVVSGHPATNSIIVALQRKIMEIKDKVILITGASGGIGSAISKHLAEHGAKMVLNDIDQRALEKLSSEIPNSVAVPGDVTQAKDAKRIVETTLERFDRIDVLINNAARGMYRSVEQIDFEEYRSLLELNTIAPLRLMQLVIPHLRKQGGGTILNISSASTKLMIVSNLAGYASTKYALNSISLTAREELKKDNITVSVIYPILVNTNFGKNAVPPEPDWFRSPGPSDPHLPMITPERVAEKTLALLLSGEAEMVVGEH
jgi:short-subunit dehydrogenase